MKIWVVTDTDNRIAIFETELIEEHSVGVFIPSYLSPGARTFVKKSNWFKTRAGVIKRANAIRKANIQKLKRAIERMEIQVFE
jgi:hypothetical protein